MARGEDWTRREVDAAVAAYLEMLELEQRGESFVKARFNERIRQQLDGRSEGSVEYKLQNISAAMLDLGFPYIEGYKPARNYQSMVKVAAAELLNSADSLLQVLGSAAEAEADRPEVDDILALEEAAPTAERTGVMEIPTEYQVTVTPRKTNFLEVEARNRSLGKHGELLVLDFERSRLAQAGRANLAGKVEHVSETQGDGLGFDVKSYEENGKDRLIEVKTTRGAKFTPFFVSRNELAVSKKHARSYQLYRLFKFRETPRMFRVPGALDGSCLLEAESYKARVG